MRKKAIIILVAIILSITSLLVLRNRDLTIHVISEAENPSTAMILKFDNKVLLKKDVSNWVYLHEKIVVENVSIGFHNLEIEALGKGVVCEEVSFFFLNKTIIITYFDKSANSKIPHFETWRKFGEFLPD